MTDQIYHFEFSMVGASVKPEEGIIKGVSIITSGILAKGHDLEVDAKTLSQMKECAEKKGKVPVKWNHKTGADAVNGYLKNFRIDGNKLKADWHLLKSHERYAHALELATEMPENIGLSASFMGKDEEKGGKKFARCSDLVSVDLVATPAANPDGLFEARVDTAGNDMAGNAEHPNGAAESNKEFSLADVMAGINQLTAGFNALAERTERLEHFAADLEEAGIQYADEVEGDEDDGNEGDDGEGGHELNSLEDGIRYLEARLGQIEDAKERAASEHAFEVLEDRVGQLLELNAQLTAENSAMAEAIQEFSAHTGAVVEFSAGADGGYEPHVMVPGDGQAKARTEFEARVQQLEADGKEGADAIRLAMRENPGRYQRHLEELGVIARNL